MEECNTASSFIWVIGLKAKGLDSCYNTAYMSQTQEQQHFYNIQSGSWLTWANDTGAHYVAIHCPC